MPIIPVSKDALVGAVPGGWGPEIQCDFSSGGRRPGLDSPH